MNAKHIIREEGNGEEEEEGGRQKREVELKKNENGCDTAKSDK